MADQNLDQQSLGRTLDRARASEDRELAVRVREFGEQLARQLFGLLRMTRLHAMDNEAYDKPLVELQRTVATLVELLGAIYLVLVEDQIYVNDIRVRVDERSDVGALLAEELRRYQIGGVVIHDVPDLTELRGFVTLFTLPPVSSRPRQFLQQHCVSTGLLNFELSGIYRFRTNADKPIATRVDLQRVAARTTRLVESAFDNLGANRLPNPLPLRRAVTDILEAGEGTERLWDEPAGASPYGAHALRVSIVAMLIARAAGLSEEAIQDLGVAAMFHDVGYAAREGAQRASEATEERAGYAPPFERHAPAGARLLIRQRGFHAAKVYRVLATLQHHRDAGDSLGRPLLHARILRIAEAYDSLQRADGPAMDPPTALRCLAGHTPGRYDPLLVQLLVNTLGAYPPGTLLELEDGRVVRSCGFVRSPETFDEPLCEVVTETDGRAPAEPMRVDLSLGGVVRRVVGGTSRVAHAMDAAAEFDFEVED